MNTEEEHDGHMKDDPVTGLPSRETLVIELEKMSRGSSDAALLAVAIDGYSVLERDHGAGAEEAVREVARRLNRLVRAEDLLAVLSPGVFAVAGPGVRDDNVDVLLQRIRGAFAMPIEVGDGVVSLPVTVGVGYREPGGDGPSMLVAAELDLRHRLGQT